MRDLFLPANGLLLHVVDYGGTGAPLLMVHGTGLVARVWDPIASALATHFHVFALDRRGCGESDQPQDGYQLRDAAADVAGIVETLGITGCHGMGHSSGATSLMVAAAEHPGLLSRIVAVDPIIFPRRDGRVAVSSMVERTRRRRSTWPSARAM